MVGDSLLVLRYVKVYVDFRFNLLEMPSLAYWQHNHVDSGLDRLVLFYFYSDISIKEELFKIFVFIFQVDRRGSIAYNQALGRPLSRFLVEHATHVLEKNEWLIDIASVYSGKHRTNLARDAQIAEVDVFYARRRRLGLLLNCGLCGGEIAL